MPEQPAKRQIGYRLSTAQYKGGMDHLAYLNRSPSSDDAALLWNNGFGLELAIDATPPEITFYNMTSEGGAGCTVWNTNKNNACNTTTTLPTLRINTSENSFCRIGGNSQNKNYTDMGSSRNCSGGGTMVHTCVLTSQDAINQDISSIYIGCKDDPWGNENLTSTSGALNVSYTSGVIGESAARALMETGIQNALSSGYTLYTDQKIYARNSANLQILDSFDKVVKWTNKIWAFNYLTGIDTPSAMFNITPSLYVLNMENLTSGQINTTVYNFILSTK